MSSERRRNIVITIPQGWVSVLIATALAVVLPWLLVQALVMLAYFGQISNVWLIGTTWGDSAAVATALWSAGYLAPISFGGTPAITLPPLGASAFYLFVLWGALRAWAPKNPRAAWYTVIAYPIMTWAISYAGGYFVDHHQVALGALLIGFLACLAYVFTLKPRRDREARQARAAQLKAVTSAGVSLETGNLDVHAEAAAQTEKHRINIPWKKQSSPAAGAAEGATETAQSRSQLNASVNPDDVATVKMASVADVASSTAGGKTSDAARGKTSSAATGSLAKSGKKPHAESRFARWKAKWLEQREARKQEAVENDQGVIRRMRNWDNAVSVDARLQRSGIDRRAHRVALPFVEVPLPGWVFDGIAAAGRVLLTLAIATGATLIVWFSGASKQIADIHAVLGTTSWENLLLFVAQLGFVMTLQTWALAWWTGSDFWTATNSVHSLGVAGQGPVPAIPALVAIPRTAPGYGLIAITVVVAIVLGWWLYTGFARASFARHLGVAVVFGAITTGVVALCAVASWGAIGAGRMSFLGVHPGMTIGLFAASFIAPLLIVFIALHPQVRGMVSGRRHLSLPNRNRVGKPEADADDTQTQWIELPEAASSDINRQEGSR